jgi:hypothetical protein
MASGGNHPPAKPAAVSGPGSLSKRTDGGPSNPHQVISTAPDQAYGDAKQQHADEATAPMAGKPALPNVPAVQPQGPPGGPAPQQGAPAYPGGDFSAPTARPGEPVTHGTPVGPGAGPEALQLGPGAPSAPPTTGALTQTLQQLSQNDMTGVLAQLYQTASRYGV